MDINPNEDERDLKALELRLTAWRPSAGALDRDRMLDDAGRAAAARGRRWRLATAGFAVVTLGLGALLAPEHSQRRALEVALATRATPSRPSPSIEIADILPIESPAPSSYFALTARLAANPVDTSWPDVMGGHERHPTSPAPREVPRRPVPVRPRDIERVLDL